MKIIVHYPSDEKAEEELKKRVAEVHSECVISYIKKQPLTKEQKLLIIDKLAEKCS